MVKILFEFTSYLIFLLTDWTIKTLKTFSANTLKNNQIIIVGPPISDILKFEKERKMSVKLR